MEADKIGQTFGVLKTSILNEKHLQTFLTNKAAQLVSNHGLRQTPKPKS